MASPSQSLRALTHLILEARSNQTNILGTDHEPAHWTSYGRLIPDILRIAATLEDLPESLDHFDEQSLGEASVVLINRLGIGFDEARAILETTLALVQAIFEAAVEQAENIVSVVADQMSAPEGDASEDDDEDEDEDDDEDEDEDEGEDEDETPTPPVEEVGVTNAPDTGSAPVEQAPETPPTTEGEGAPASGDEQGTPAEAPAPSEPTGSAGEAAASPEPEGQGSLPAEPSADAPAPDAAAPAPDAPAPDAPEPAVGPAPEAPEPEQPAAPAEPAAAVEPEQPAEPAPAEPAQPVDPAQPAAGEAEDEADKDNLPG